jgi:hypothetical protein
VSATLRTQLTCAVPVDEPIFQPFPPEVSYHAYEPFKEYKALLYLRNNDTVGVCCCERDFNGSAVTGVPWLQVLGHVQFAGL